LVVEPLVEPSVNSFEEYLIHSFGEILINSFQEPLKPLEGEQIVDSL
jgi:hypothetical protein